MGFESPSNPRFRRNYWEIRDECWCTGITRTASMPSGTSPYCNGLADLARSREGQVWRSMMSKL